MATKTDGQGNGMWFREREVEVIRMEDLNSGRQKRKKKIQKAKSRRLATWIPAVAADRSHQRNRFIMSAPTFIFF